MAEHTPGPWRVEQGPTHLEVKAPHQTERAVARVYCDFDAALIAAAPDLLAACEALFVRLHYEAGGRESRWDSALELLRKAIARAEGKDGP